MIRVSVCAAVLIVGVAVNQFLVLGESDLPALKNPKLIVTKSERKLEVFDGEELIKTYRIALGSSPVGDKEVEDPGRRVLYFYKKPAKQLLSFSGLELSEYRRCKTWAGREIDHTGRA